MLWCKEIIRDRIPTHTHVPCMHPEQVYYRLQVYWRADEEQFTSKNNLKNCVVDCTSDSIRNSSGKWVVKVQFSAYSKQ